MSYTLTVNVEMGGVLDIPAQMVKLLLLQRVMHG